MNEFLQENPIEQYPEVYRVEEVQHISNAQLPFYQQMDETVDKIEQNGVFSTADLATIERYEKMLDITTINGETLEFRRARVENRFNLNKKYVMLFYCEKLNELIGPGKWHATINARRTVLTIESNARDANWYKELITTLNMIKPVRLRLDVKLAITDKMTVTGKTKKQKIIYTFKVGVSRLGVDTIGQKTGAAAKIGGIMLSKTQIQKFINEIETNAKSVLVNDETTINQFTLKTSTENTLVLEYVIPADVTYIGNVKLMNGKEILAEAAVNIVNADNVLIQHTFMIEAKEEG